jgi:protein TonB
MATDEVMPKVERQVLPAYPATPAADGVVDLEVVVDTAGSVIHSRVVRSPDVSGVIDRASLDVLPAWRFKPFVSASGQRVPSLIRMRFEFSPPAAPGRAGRVSVHISPLPRVLPPRWTTESAGIETSTSPGPVSPTALRRVLPRYSADALRAKIQGVVTVEAVVLADGTLGPARVTRSLDPGLDDEALYAVRYWHFEPAMRNGSPVAVTVTLELEFRIR